MESYGFPITRSGNKKYYKGLRLVRSIDDIMNVEDKLMKELKMISDLFGNRIPRDDLRKLIERLGYQNPDDVISKMLSSGLLIEVENDRFSLVVS
jgi:hypothetical protein